MKNTVTRLNGYITTTRPDGRVSFIMPDVAKTLTNKQINEITQENQPEPEAPKMTAEESKAQVLSELKELLSKKTYGYSKAAKLEFLVNHCEADSFAEIEAMSEWGIKCLIEKLEGK